MSITINLTPTEEALLSTEAKQNGLAPEQLAHNLLRDSLKKSASTRDLVKAKLREWQAETNTQFASSESIAELFARWEKEDANMTKDEIAAMIYI